MADLSKWVDPVSLGPFRMGLRNQQEIDLTALTNAELIERVGEFLPKLVSSWRTGDDPGDAYLLVRGLRLCPDVSDLLSDEEARDLGV